VVYAIVPWARTSGKNEQYTLPAYSQCNLHLQVLVKVNGQLMNFTLELGSFGSAFFAHEQEQEQLSPTGDQAADEGALLQFIFSTFAAHQSKQVRVNTAHSGA
jgi:phosphatidate phosphatase PAH1